MLKNPISPRCPPYIHHVFHGFPQDVHHISIYPTWIHHVFPEMSTIYPPFITHLPIVSSHPMASPRGPRHHGTSRPRSTSAAARAMCDSKESKVEAWSSAADTWRFFEGRWLVVWMFLCDRNYESTMSD